MSQNNASEWSLHLEYDPERGSPADRPDEELVQLIRTAIGRNDIAVELVGYDDGDHAVAVRGEPIG